VENPFKGRHFRGLFNKRVIRGNGLQMIAFTLAELSNCNNRTYFGVNHKPHKRSKFNEKAMEPR